MQYFPNSEKSIREMLDALGVSKFEDLLTAIPEAIRVKGQLNLPEALSESQLMSHVNELAAQNTTAISFAGGGAYDHYVPAAINHILSRSEFYTAYTPYQPEVSQGTLQAIYEFQTLISKITNMPVVNASMYDGGTSLAEAVLMAANVSRKLKIAIPENLNPRYKRIIETYTSDSSIELIPIPTPNGIIEVDQLDQLLDDSFAAVVMQNPNFFGIVEDGQSVSEIAHKYGALFIVSADPSTLSILTPPGDYDADIVTGEGQSLGIPVNFGGPYLGLFATTQKFIRKIPGRLIGMTEDLDGKRGFVMVMQTREQHIRREKATSNICTNSGLMALASTIYLSLMGETGFRQAAEISLNNSHYLAEELTKIKGVSLRFNQPYFKEFVINTPLPASHIIDKMAQAGILAGIDLDRYNMGEGLLVAVTEKRSKGEIDEYITRMRDVIQNG